jgi:CRP/FNR family transcriptional regulator, cyclic AMP receptor protein
MKTIGNFPKSCQANNGIHSLDSMLLRHPFLEGMKPEHLEIMAACAMQTCFEERQSIFREGDSANRFYLIQEGRVVMETETAERSVIPIQIIGPGDALGWSWLFQPHYWQFDARALEPTKALFFYGTRLREYCEQDHDLGYELMKRVAAVIVKRLQATRRQLIRFSALS